MSLAYAADVSAASRATQVEVFEKIVDVARAILEDEAGSMSRTDMRQRLAELSTLNEAEVLYALAYGMSLGRLVESDDGARISLGVR